MLAEASIAPGGRATRRAEHNDDARTPSHVQHHVVPGKGSNSLHGRDRGGDAPAGLSAQRHGGLSGLRRVPDARGWLERHGPVPVAEIRALRQDVGTRIIVRSIASAVLLLCTLATLWLQQRQLAIRRTLHQVKLLAHNILSSLNQGVITTDQRAIITSINSAAIDLIGVDVDCIGRPIARISSPEVPLETCAERVDERKGAVRDCELTLERAGRVRRLVASVAGAEGHARGDDRLRDPPARRHRAHAHEGADVADGAVRQPQHPGVGALHEIKNPMTALSIHVQLLEERLSRSLADEPAAEMIGVLKTEVRRLNNTLASFRDFASLRAAAAQADRRAGRAR